MLQQDFLAIFTVRHLGRSLRFYREVLGFGIEQEDPEDAFAFVHLIGQSGNDIRLLLEQGTAEELKHLHYPYGGGLSFSFRVRNLQALYDRVQASGYPVFRAMTRRSFRVDDQIRWSKVFALQDPDGYLLSFRE